MNKVTEIKQRQRKRAIRRKMVTSAVLVGVTTWFIASAMFPTKSTEEPVHDTTMNIIEEKEVLQREVRRLELVVSNGVFFQGDVEWKADDISYYDIPLSQELQQYTYTRCVDLNIGEYYELVLALMWQESNYDPNVISKTNDYGLMQINKVNHEWLSNELGITDFLDPYQSIDAGTHIIASLLLKYQDPHKALMAYNYGEAGARGHWNRGTYTSSYSREVAGKQEQILNKGI